MKAECKHNSDSEPDTSLEEPAPIVGLPAAGTEAEAEPLMEMDSPTEPDSPLKVDTLQPQKTNEDFPDTLTDCVDMAASEGDLATREESIHGCIADAERGQLHAQASESEPQPSQNNQEHQKEPSKTEQECQRKPSEKEQECVRKPAEKVQECVRKPAEKDQECARIPAEKDHGKKSPARSLDETSTNCGQDAGITTSPSSTTSPGFSSPGSLLATTPAEAFQMTPCKPPPQKVPTEPAEPLASQLPSTAPKPRHGFVLENLTIGAAAQRLRRLMQPRKDGSYLIPQDFVDMYRDVQNGGRQKIEILFEKMSFNVDMGAQISGFWNA